MMTDWRFISIPFISTHMFNCTICIRFSVFRCSSLLCCSILFCLFIVLRGMIFHWCLILCELIVFRCRSLSSSLCYAMLLCYVLFDAVVCPCDSLCCLNVASDVVVSYCFDVKTIAVNWFYVLLGCYDKFGYAMLLLSCCVSCICMSASYQHIN